MARDAIQMRVQPSAQVFLQDFACNSLLVQVLKFGGILAHIIGKSVRRSAGWTSKAGTRGTAVLFVRNRKTNGTVSAGPTHTATWKRPSPIVVLTHLHRARKLDFL